MNIPGATDVGRRSFQELAVSAWRNWSVCFGYWDWAGRVGGWAAPDFVGRGCCGVCASDAGYVRQVDSTCFIRPLQSFAKRWPSAWHCCACGTPGASRRRWGSGSGLVWRGSGSSCIGPVPWPFAGVPVRGGGSTPCARGSGLSAGRTRFVAAFCLPSGRGRARSGGLPRLWWYFWSWGLSWGIFVLSSSGSLRSFQRWLAWGWGS